MEKEKLQTLIALLEELKDEYTKKWVQAFHDSDTKALSLSRISDECFYMGGTCKAILEGASYTQYERDKTK